VLLEEGKQMLLFHLLSRIPQPRRPSFLSRLLLLMMKRRRFASRCLVQMLQTACPRETWSGSHVAQVLRLARRSSFYGFDTGMQSVLDGDSGCPSRLLGSSQKPNTLRHAMGSDFHNLASYPGCPRLHHCGGGAAPSPLSRALCVDTASYPRRPSCF
jgi:hypothetical protein